MTNNLIPVEAKACFDEHAVSEQPAIQEVAAEFYVVLF